MHALYLHGFASGPHSRKGQAVGALLAGRVRSYAVVDLERGDFRGLTIDRILARTVAAAAALPADGAPLLLIGSSLGGYCSALLAARRMLPRLAALVLVAPAFGFASRWRERLGDGGIARWRAQGELPFFHHGEQRELPLGVGFLDSCQGLPDLPGDPGVPAAIVHGRRDETVSWEGALAYARAHPRCELHLVDGEHSLTEPHQEALIAWCAQDLVARGERF